MAAATFRLEVATPERQLINEAVTEASVPCESGYIGVLPGHAPLLGELGIGELTYKLVSGQSRTVGVHKGFVEVSGNYVRVLANNAEHPNEVDVARTELALKRANERVMNPLPGVDIARALNAMRRAKARLDLSNHASR